MPMVYLFLPRVEYTVLGQFVTIEFNQLVANTLTRVVDEVNKLTCLMSYMGPPLNEKLDFDWRRSNLEFQKLVSEPTPPSGLPCCSAVPNKIISFDNINKIFYIKLKNMFMGV